MSENIHGADHPVLVRMTEGQIQESLRDRDRAQEYDELFLKLKRGLELAGAIATGEEKMGRRLPDGRLVPGPQGILAQRRAAVALAMREIKGFLAAAGIDEGLLQPLTWVMSAASDAQTGAPNPLFTPLKPQSRPPEDNHGREIAGVAAAALRRLVKGGMKKAEASREVVEVLAKGGITKIGKAGKREIGVEAKDRRLNPPGLLKILDKIEVQHNQKPEERPRDVNTTRLRFFEIALRHTEGMEARAAAEMILKTLVERYSINPKTDDIRG